jgi:hypothetical protein
MGEGWIFLKTFRTSLFNDDLSNEKIVWQDPSRWTLPLSKIGDEVCVQVGAVQERRQDFRLSLSTSEPECLI